MLDSIILLLGQTMNRLFIMLFAAWIPFSAFALEKEAREMPKGGIDKALLGQILFFDNNLSFHGNQNCSSCHSPDTAFVDLRENSADKIVQKINSTDYFPYYQITSNPFGFFYNRCNGVPVRA